MNLNSQKKIHVAFDPSLDCMTDVELAARNFFFIIHTMHQMTCGNGLKDQGMAQLYLPYALIRTKKKAQVQMSYSLFSKTEAMSRDKKNMDRSEWSGDQFPIIFPTKKMIMKKIEES